MVRIRINRHLAMTRSFKRGIQMNMGHHFNGDDCSIANLVFTPIEGVNDHLSKREAEEELKKLKTL